MQMKLYSIAAIPVFLLPHARFYTQSGRIDIPLIIEKAPNEVRLKLDENGPPYHGCYVGIIYHGEEVERAWVRFDGNGRLRTVFVFKGDETHTTCKAILDLALMRKQITDVCWTPVKFNVKPAANE